MSDGAPARRSRLTPEREAELYDTVLDMLRDGGYDALTMDAVAQRTRSSKATLYRQWGGKPQLVVRAMRHHKSPAPLATGGRSLREDLHALVCSKTDRSMGEDADLMRGMAVAIHSDPELGEAVKELLVEPEREAISALLDAAVRRGELAASNPAIPLVFHMILGGVLARAVIEEEAPTAEYVTHWIDAVVLPALGLPQES